MRTFIRHPSDIPIEIHHEQGGAGTEENLSNISTGGLSFKAETPLQEGATIRVRIPVVMPVFETVGKVVWCRRENHLFDVGVQFMRSTDSFRLRMIEQICHIEHYKREIQEKEGRSLSGREAAMEWISKFAGSFHEESLEKIEK